MYLALPLPQCDNNLEHHSGYHGFCTSIPVFWTRLGVPNVALESAMACHVFQWLRTVLIADFNATTISNEPTILCFTRQTVVILPSDHSCGVHSPEDSDDDEEDEEEGEGGGEEKEGGTQETEDA